MLGFSSRFSGDDGLGFGAVAYKTSTRSVHCRFGRCSHHETSGQSRRLPNGSFYIRPEAVDMVGNTSFKSTVPFSTE